MRRSRHPARTVALRLEAAGIPADRIRLIGRQQTGDDQAAQGAAIGGVAGGAAGLLAGLGMVTIPGLGPVVAFGWLASTIVGAGTAAAAGGAIGAAAGAGPRSVGDTDYTSAVRRGGAVVAVKTDATMLPRVTAVLDEGMPIDGADERSSDAGTERAGDLSGSLS